MMNPIRTKVLRRTILEVLQMAGEYPLLDQSLRQYVGDLARPRITDEEWAQHIKWLVDGSRIRQAPCKIDPDAVQWLITENGETLLLSLT